MPICIHNHTSPGLGSTVNRKVAWIWAKSLIHEIVIAACTRAPRVSRVQSWATFIFLLPSASLHLQDLLTRTVAFCHPTATLAALLYLPESQSSGGCFSYTVDPRMRQLGPLDGMDRPRGLFFHLSTTFMLSQFPFPLKAGTNPLDQKTPWNASCAKYHPNNSLIRQS